MKNTRISITTGTSTALAAGAWFALAARGICEELLWSLVANLSLAVWGIYLADRLWDKRVLQCPDSGKILRGSVWAVWFFAAVGFGGVALASCSLGQAHTVSGRIIAGVGVCISATGWYYAVRVRNRNWQRGRDFVVTGIFWIGTVGLALMGRGQWPGWAHLAVLALLWANARMCLGLVKNSVRGYLEIVGLLAVALGLALCAREKDAVLIASAVILSTFGHGWLLLKMRSQSKYAVPTWADAMLGVPALSVLLLARLR